ncbi:MAG: 50S ribosome-binding GTPase [Bacteroidales bacterium]|nr:50S ribosome-binding GTPase [Bacteroidales bacterium]
MAEKTNARFLIDEIFDKIFKKAKVSQKEQEQVNAALNKELIEKPFRVAVIGQSGVGKSTTLNSVFGLKNYTSNLAEGTTEIVEKIFPLRDGFKLSIYDMPGLNNDVDKDIEYEKLYKKILPDCDVIVYIINAHSRDFGEDCRILKEVVLPICNNNQIRENMVLAVNKIDTIGENIDPNDPELQWDVFRNEPTKKLKAAIKTKLGDIVDKLIDERLLGTAEGFAQHQVVFYSAVFNYNLQDFIRAISKAGKRGWIWPATVGFEQAGRWSDAKVIAN